MSSPNIALVIIVNGTGVTVSANPNAALQSVKEQALRDSGNIGQPPENWEFRDKDGNVLDAHKKISEFTGIQIFLNLKAGIGG